MFYSIVRRNKECRSNYSHGYQLLNKTTNTNEDIDFSKAIQVIRALLNLFKTPSVPAPPVGKIQTLSSTLRPGLSATKIAANIIKRQEEAGAFIGANDDGSENISEKMERIRVEEIVNALVTDARVTITQLPGQTITATGGNAGGPVQVIGQTITLGKGTGLIQ
jgi:hypothetical protein